jgi:cytochrome c oxidase subunit 1
MSNRPTDRAQAMTFTQTLLEGHEGSFQPHTLTPMQKLTLRFVVVGLVFYGFAATEGMLMRICQIEPISLFSCDQYFGILTAHPLVGIFGSSYPLVFGTFLFLVPFLMKKPLWSYRLANWTSG